MRIVYIADDGTEFNNEYDCENYEWKLNHKAINRIKMYDKINNLIMTDFFNEDTYNNSYTIIVPDEEAAKELHELAEYAGWCEWESIDSSGVWRYDESRNYSFFKDS